MSVTGLFDLRIDQYRHNQATTDSMGDVATAPTLTKSNMRGALSNARMRSQDGGAGDAPAGITIFYFSVRDDVRLGDTLHVTKGSWANTWWTVMEPMPNIHGKHKEVQVKPYIGKRP
jgi:hypothetical protein